MVERVSARDGTSGAVRQDGGHGETGADDDQQECCDGRAELDETTQGNPSFPASARGAVITDTLCYRATDVKYF